MFRQLTKLRKKLYKQDGEKQARKFLSEFSVNEANNMTERWKELGQYLLVKYMDGNIKREKDGKFERTETGMAPAPIFAGYPEWWYKAIVKVQEIILRYWEAGH